MQVLTPTSLEEACAFMRGTGNPSEISPSPLPPPPSPLAPIPIAGATDLLVHWPTNLPAHDNTYLDLSRLTSLRSHRWTSTHLELGALTTYWDIITDPRAARDLPLLVKAARTVGAIQIQARGTWAGNIANASPAADGVPALMAYDASIILVSYEPSAQAEDDSRLPGGHRELPLSAAKQTSQSPAPITGTLTREEIPLDEFYLGYKQMRKRPDQLIESIRIPLRTYTTSIFEKVGARRAQAITKVGAAIARSDAVGGGWRVVANSVAPTIRRCRNVEQLLESGTPIRSPTDLAPALTKDIAPIDDIRSTAKYRQQVLARLIFFALRKP